MMRIRIPRLPRAAAAALFLALAACGGDGITTPRVLAGHWLAVETFGATSPQAVRIEDRLELGSDGDYEWTTITFASGGRASDGMAVWQRHIGRWGVDGRMLALRTLSGLMWQFGGSWSQLDYEGTWHRGHTVRTEGDRMIVEEHFGGPTTRFAPPRTYVFQRVDNFDGAPQPPAPPIVN